MELCHNYATACYLAKMLGGKVVLQDNKWWVKI